MILIKVLALFLLTTSPAWIVFIVEQVKLRRRRREIARVLAAWPGRPKRSRDGK